MLRIVISGPTASGKTTVANAIFKLLQLLGVPVQLETPEGSTPPDLSRIMAVMSTIGMRVGGVTISEVTVGRPAIGEAASTTTDPAAQRAVERDWAVIYDVLNLSSIPREQSDAAYEAALRLQTAVAADVVPLEFRFLPRRVFHGMVDALVEYLENYGV